MNSDHKQQSVGRGAGRKHENRIVVSIHCRYDAAYGSRRLRTCGEQCNAAELQLTQTVQMCERKDTYIVVIISTSGNSRSRALIIPSWPSSRNMSQAMRCSDERVCDRDKSRTQLEAASWWWVDRPPKTLRSGSYMSITVMIPIRTT